MTLKESALHLWTTTKYGYNETYWIFVVIGSGAIFGQLFGITGIGAVFATLCVFYAFGQAHKKITGGAK